MLSTPITGIAGCCARAANGHAGAPPIRPMNCRRRITSTLDAIAPQLSNEHSTFHIKVRKAARDAAGSALPRVRSGFRLDPRPFYERRSRSLCLVFLLFWDPYYPPVAQPVCAISSERLRRTERPHGAGSSRCARITGFLSLSRTNPRIRPLTALPGQRGDQMSKEDTYRRNAVEFAELALRGTSVSDRARMFRSAEAWLDLANLAHRRSGRRVRNVGEYPRGKGKSRG
jgi:hypothetical protein